MTSAPPPDLDDVDRHLLRILEADGRAAYATMAAEVGLSAPAVRSRVQRLVDAGVLQVVGVTDPLALGFGVMAMVGVRVTGDVRAVADALGQLPGVVYLVFTAGEHDLLVEIVCRGQDELFAVVNDRLRAVPGVVDARVWPYFGIHTHRFTWSGSRPEHAGPRRGRGEQPGPAAGLGPAAGPSVSGGRWGPSGRR